MARSGLEASRRPEKTGEFRRAWVLSGRSGYLVVRENPGLRRHVEATQLAKDGLPVGERETRAALADAMAEEASVKDPSPSPPSPDWEIKFEQVLASVRKRGSFR